jgi:histidine decarboxylase
MSRRLHPADREDRDGLVEYVRSRLTHRSLGAPGATDLDFTALAEQAGLGELTDLMAINIGNPFVEGREVRNTKLVERAVIRSTVRLLGGDPDEWRGYVPSGSTEGIHYGLWLARTRYPRGIVYHSTAAHTCIAKAAHLLGLPTRAVAVDEGGRMRPDALTAAIDPRWPVLLVVTAGTTMTEAVDDVAALHTAAHATGAAVYTHVDAALSGIPLALDHRPPAAVWLPSGRVDSWSTSGHKFLATRRPCGIVLARREHVEQLAHRRVPYTGDNDVTIGGCRDGQAVIRLWLSLTHADHRARIAHARRLAIDTVQELRGRGYHAWRHPHAFTVTIDTPPDSDLVARWELLGHHGRVHLITVPGVTRRDVDEFLSELRPVSRTPAAPVLRTSPA